MDTLGKRIRQARGRLSQDAFCSLIGVSKGSLGFYERDENLPKVDVIVKICSKTGVALEWLVTGSGKMWSGDADPAPALEQPHEESDTMKAELEREREERRTLAAENRQLYQRCLEQERVIGELKLALQAARGEISAVDAHDFAPSVPLTTQRSEG